jgi:TctA family transporter
VREVAWTLGMLAALAMVAPLVRVLAPADQVVQAHAWWFTITLCALLLAYVIAHRR